MFNMIDTVNIELDEEEKDKMKEYNVILKEKFGYESLKIEQFKVINSVLDGKDTLAIFSTGAGKSLNFQMLHLISNQNIIVISPLISLILDQFKEMEERNIDTCIFNSSIKKTLITKTKKELLSGKSKIIFMTPEFFAKSEEFIKELYENGYLKAFVIDECHCVSGWSDFRKSYLELSMIKEWIPKIPILGLSATLSKNILADVIKILNLEEPNIFRGDFDRKNLYFEVKQKNNETFNKIIDLINEYKEDYIILYCLTRKETDNLSEQLTNNGIKSKAYHAGLDPEQRNTIQKNYINGDFKVICATISFGLGINIPNVKLVIHYNCPKNLDGYIQETGRAGRSINIQAKCFLFYTSKDFTTHKFFLSSMSDGVLKKYQEEQINEMEKFCYSKLCRRKIMLANYGQIKESCDNCDNCLNNIREQKIIKSNYYIPTYLFLKVLEKFNGKFGSGIIINILLGKKVKEDFKQLNEYGSGTPFGNINWWKNLFLTLKLNDFISSKQIKGSFGSSISLSNKSIKWLNAQKEKYRDSIVLLTDTNFKEELLFEQIDSSNEKISKKIKNTKIEKNLYV
jgi:RecQ family ATP-dependent DNA helicase